MDRRLYFLMIIVLCTFWLSFSCEEEKQETVFTENNRNEYPSQEGWQSELILTKAGRRQAVVRYGHMMKYDKKKVILFDQGVEVDFFDDEGNHTSHLTSEKGEYWEDTEDIIGRGHVFVESDSGATLRTEVLRWDNLYGKIVSDTLVMVTTQDQDTLYGTGFTSNADLSRRIIHKPWGVSDNKVDIEKLESSFSRPTSVDTIRTEDISESPF